MDPRIGTEFAGHRIEQVIGRGGVSVVYLAEHLQLGRKVALKVLAPHLAEDDAFRERFIRESRIAAGLDHPNIVTIYDAGEFDDSLYISMRYVEGSDLAHLLRTEGPLESARTLLLLSQVADALDAAHEQGLVHRDVKPANVLVEASGLERAYLSDFGISKRTTTGSGLTKTGQFVGTIDYTAPEQISGEPVDGRTDVYSLTCVLYQCLAGRVPFVSETEVATIYRQLHDPPPSMEGSIEPWDRIDAVLATGMAKSKEGRYPTCGALIEAARVALAGAGEVTALGPRPQRASPATRVGDTEVREVGAYGGGVAETVALDRPGTKARGRRALWASIVGAAVVAVMVAALVLATRTPQPDQEAEGSGAGATDPLSPPATSGDRVLLTWSTLKSRSLPGDQAMFDVVATRDGLVAVGHVPGSTETEDDAAVWFSADTDRWRTSTSGSLGGPGDQRMLTISASAGLLLAGGWDGPSAAVWASQDGGGTWTYSQAGDLNLDVKQQIRDIEALDPTMIVAVGGAGPDGDQDAAVWTSSDGLGWTRVADDDLAAVGDQQMWAVRKIGGTLFAVGYTYTSGGSYDGAIWTSDDGRDWRRLDPTMFAADGHQLMKDVAVGEEGTPLVVAGCEDAVSRCDTDSVTGADAAVWISTDGENWSQVELAGSGVVGEGVQVMLGLSRDGGTFVAAGTATARSGDLDAMIWTSTDGLSWSPQLRPQYKVRALGGPADQTIRGVAPFHRRGLSFVAVGAVTDGAQQDAMVWGGS